MSRDGAQALRQPAARGGRTVVGAVAWAALLAIVAMLANGCSEIACVDACEEALERCKTGLSGSLTAGVLSEGDCRRLCAGNASARCECFDCVNEEERCTLSCRRDDSCLKPFEGSIVDG